MPSFHTIVCGLDFSPASRSALLRAADLAGRERATLHTLHVGPRFGAGLALAPRSGADAELRARAHAFVAGVLGADALGATDPATRLVQVVHEAGDATPADGLLQYAADVNADLIVMGTHGRRGLGEVLLGSVASDTLRRSAVPVLVVPEAVEQAAPGPEAPVLLGVDFSGHSAPALAAAQAFTTAYGAPLALAHIRDVPADTLVAPPRRRPLTPPTGLTSREAAHDALDALLADAEIDPASAEQHVVPGRPGDVLPALTRRLRAGLLVVGTHGRRGWDRLRLGSVADEVVRRSACPVVVVPSPARHRDAPATPSEASATA